jgi:hypothetical protein
MRYLAMCALFFSGLIACTAIAAEDPPAQPEPGTAVCTFVDDKQMSVRYNRPAASGKKDELPIGKLWAPGDSPMHLFTEAPITVGTTQIPIGAYSVYLIPEKEKWTLIVNKNVTAGSKYDQQQDLVRAPMQTGKLTQVEKQLTIYFGHIAPRQCSMRVDYGQTRAWIEFDEK